MDVSKSKKRDKLDLSKLSARELLLIGESSTFSQVTEDDSTSSGTSSSDDDSDDDSWSENDWEEVSDQHVEEQLKKYDQTSTNGATTSSSEAASQLSSIPENGLEIVIPKEGVFVRKNKKQITIEDLIRRQINSDRIELQELLHETSLLCQLARGLQLNTAINSSTLRDAIEERMKNQKLTVSPKRLDISSLERSIKWFRSNMLISKPSMQKSLETTQKSLSDEEFLVYQVMEKTSLDTNYSVMIFVAFLRYFKVDVRLVISMMPIPLRPPASDLLRKPKEDGDDGKQGDKETAGRKKKSNEKEKKSRTPTKKAKSSRKKKRGRKARSTSASEESESEGEVERKSTVKEIKRGQDMWAEVYLFEEERWASVDILSGKVICDKQLEMEASQPLTYIVGFDNKNKLKDVTRRYASEWLTTTKKLRLKSYWWDITLKPYRGRQTTRDKEEDDFLDEHLLSLPIPKSLSEIKSHPLYVVRRHLLKYEALYPENPPNVGFIKNEAIYSRDNVHTLHTRELWMRQAKLVRIGEAPYKIVKARPKYDRLSGARLPEAPSELFGVWQTEDYIPPIAQNGKVPRNEWGNVELFTEKLLPQGCVHLRLPGLQRVAKKLDIDCAPAVVGFDFGCGGSRPAFDGFVVCEEFKETLLDAWNQEQDEKKKKDEEKRLQRIYSNWRKLVRGVLIRDNLEKKYGVNLSGKRKAEGSSSSDPLPSSSKRSKKK